MKIITFIEQSVGRVSANVWLLLFVLANFFVKSYHISYESLYGDEPYSLFFGQQTISDAIPQFLQDQNPPLHISLLHFWMMQFGISDISAKMLSVVCSVLAAAVLFMFAKKFIDKTTAIFVSLLFLFSNAQQYFAIEVRPYALVQLLCISSFYIYFNLLSTPKKKHIFFLFLMNLLLLFTHYLTIFIFIVQFLGILFYVRKNKKIAIYYIISQVLVLLVLIPWLKIAFSNIPTTGGFWNTTPDYFAFRWHTNILLGNEMLYHLLNGVVICFLLLYLLNKKVKIFSGNFNSTYYFIFLFLYLLPILLNFAVAQYTPVFVTRYFLYSLFGLFLFIAYSFSQLNLKSIYKILLFSPLVIVLVLSFNVVQERPNDWKRVIPEIAKLKEPNSLIYISPSYTYGDFSFYYDINAFRDYHHTKELLAKESVFVTKDREAKGWEKLNYSGITKIINVNVIGQVEGYTEEIVPFFISKGFTECDFSIKGGLKYSVFIRDTLDCFPVKITSINKNSKFDLFEKYDGINKTNDEVDVYKVSCENLDSCAMRIYITDKIKYSGKYSFQTNDKNQFALGIVKPVSEMLKTKRNVKFSAYLNIENGNDGWAVIAVQQNDDFIFLKNIPLREMVPTANQWQKINMNALLPDNLPNDAVVKIYFWNPSQKNIFVDDFTIQIY